MEGSAGFCTLKIMPHMMWAVPFLRRNHSQAKCRTGENKKLRSRNSPKNIIQKMFESRSSPRVLPGLAASVSPVNLFGPTNCQASPRCTKSDTLGIAPTIFVLKILLGHSDSAQEYGSPVIIFTNIARLLAVLSVNHLCVSICFES